MSFYKRKSTSLCEDGTIRDNVIKSDLIVELSKAIKRLQQQHITSKDPIFNGELTNSICNVLEAIFIHGLKDSLTSRFSSILGSGEKLPTLNFWSLVASFSHKDVNLQISQLNQISSDVGKCRAWLRLSLNEGLTLSYIEAITKDKTALSYYYGAAAFLRDSEKPDIMKRYLQGLLDFQFQLTYNNSSLNIWNEKSLIMAGMLEQEYIPHVVMVAKSAYPDDDASSDKMEKSSSGRKSIENAIEKVIETNSESPDNSLHLDQMHGNSFNNEISQSEPLIQLENPHETVDNQTYLSQSDPSSFQLPLSSIWHLNANLNIEAAENAILSRNLSLDIKSIENMNYKPGEPAILPVNTDDLSSIGNSLGYGKGWSSPFEDALVAGKFIENNTEKSFQALLQSYTPAGNSLMIVPVFKNLLGESTTPVERTSESTDETEDPLSDESDFEIISKTTLFGSNEMHIEELTSNIGTICPEKDLENQNYQCFGCKKPIGMISAKARKCSYDGYYYCFDCHENDRYYIPAFIIHKWDFKKYLISKPNQKFLEQIEDLPLIDIRKLNPLLYERAPELNDVQFYRLQLSSLRHYLFTCNQTVAGDFRKRLWPKEYLYESIHLYSLSDLIQVHSGHLAHKLKKVISFASKHVINCRLCSQKGFICEMCTNHRVIYPFEMDTTYRCVKCKAVYHKECMNETKPCRKCLRRLTRQQQTGIDFHSPDSVDYGTCVP